ncbi:MAG TPA: hypothetical protein VF719_03510 [Abditibacteriaceae bacterium]|jgi:hypothetical protein
MKEQYAPVSPEDEPPRPQVETTDVPRHDNSDSPPSPVTGAAVAATPDPMPGDEAEPRRDD